uniref:Uncharacterized protein n=1 Tax=Aegilops tauschii subsp. strangulata TaxID=200361 RepID=A0A453PY22_AEGTS
MKQFLCDLFKQEVKRGLPFACVPLWACDVSSWRSGGCWPLIFWRGLLSRTNRVKCLAQPV